MGIFGSAKSKSEFTFPFLYISIFQKWQSGSNMAYVFTCGCSSALVLPRDAESQWLAKLQN